MMIGGGGNGCGRADHGTGITEENSASFDAERSGEREYDLGYNPTEGGELCCQISTWQFLQYK